MEVPIPTISVMREFDEFAEPLFNKFFLINMKI